MTFFLPWSLLFLFHSGVFHLAESFPEEYAELKDEIKQKLSCLTSSTGALLCSNFDFNYRLSRNANESLSEQRLHRLEDYAYTHSGQCLQFRNDCEHIGDAKANDIELIIWGTPLQATFWVVFVLPVFFLVILISAYCYFYLFSLELHFLKSRRINSSSCRKREHLRVVILPPNGDRVLIIFFLVAVVLATSTHAEYPVPSCEDCYDGWLCYNSSCLKVWHTPLTWPQADEACSNHGSHLLSIENDDKDLWQYLFERYRQQPIFTGLLGSSTEEGLYTYRWSDGSPFVYSNWERLNVHCKADLCTTIIPDYSSGAYIVHWNPVACLSQNIFICKKPKKLKSADVRLVDGVTPNRGRVEIFLDGDWRRVCISGTGSDVEQTAAAVCRHLGHLDVFYASALNHSREGNFEITSDFVGCALAGNSGCANEVAACNWELFVSCQSSRTFSFDIRLTDSHVPNEGFVVFEDVNGISRQGCGSYFSRHSDSLVYCRHLGYGGGVAAIRELDLNLKTSVYVSTHCLRKSLTLAGCYFYQNSHCFHSIWLNCSYSQWQVRLNSTADRIKEREGTIEVFFNEAWTVVCNDKWDINGAQVACRQLGFKKAITANLSRSKSALGDKRDSQLQVLCNGNETTLRECQHKVIHNQSCTTAAAVCQMNEYCPLGWFLYADYCYTVTDTLPIMDDVFLGDGGCGASNSASITSPHEQAFVLSLLASLKTDVWIGLRRKENEAFEWINGDPLRYVLWAPGEPKTFYRCVALDPRAGYWKTKNCLEWSGVLCKVALRDVANELRQETAPAANIRCRSDEFYFKEACYYLSKDDDELVSQVQAQNEKCKSRNATLASISTTYENAFIASETSPSKESLYWTGLVYNETFANGNFRWHDETPVIFTKWGMYEPKHLQDSSICVLFGSDGREFVWSVSNCSAKARYVCKRDEITSYSDDLGSGSSDNERESLSTGEVYACPDGWSKIGTWSCFKRLFARMTWHFSLSNCESMGEGASLARILSLEEQKELGLILLNEEEAWIGLSDMNDEGYYVWADGSPLIYVNWNSSEVETSSYLQREKDCVAATKKAWQSISCSEMKPSLCFMPAIPDFDECSNNISDCHVNATCENILYSYICTCKPGFTGNGTSCEDINECNYACNKEGQNCSNTFGSYECACRSGWTGNGSVCVDVNECNETSICHSHANCLNYPGSYQCRCQKGWKGNGSFCSDVNECENDNPCHSQAICTNQNGSFICRCLQGWTGDGFSCNDINECLLPVTCQTSEYCRNTNGSFQCLCSSGYVGNGSHCEGIAEEFKSNSQSIIIFSVTSSVIVIFVIFLGFYVRRRALRKKRFVYNLDKRPDKWEINCGDMILLEKLGDGFFGVVHRAYLYHRPSGSVSNLALKESLSFGNRSEVACKMLKGSNNAEVDFLEEIKLMKNIGQHPHIVNFLGCITISTPFCLIVEYCKNGDLLNYLNKRHNKQLNEIVSDLESEIEGSVPASSPVCDTFTHQWREMNEDLKVFFDEGAEKKCEPELNARDLLSFAWQIASGMEYLIGKGLVHRDLACRNVLVCENKLLKVSDFGLTRAVYGDGAYSQKTTRRLPLRWMSIEAITHRLFSEQSDVWSFGVVMWEICTLGSFPYPCVFTRELLSHLRSGNRLSVPESCSTELYKIMSSCWSADPEKRPTFNRLTRLLGQMLEAENQSQYIVFDAISLLPSGSTKSRSRAMESESENEALRTNSFTQKDDAEEIRYVVGSAASAIKESNV
ncbi:uncharacterized protein [Oscarella lobularis]|uniref:uncharacterized protein isoform X2 n=1 Tax=Oscarella lobularis TaxID=121494 RepID=UPI003313CAD7